MKLTLRSKLGLGFGAILALMIFGTTVTYWKSADIGRNQDGVFQVRLPSLTSAIRLQRDLNQTQVKGRQAILAGTQPARLAEAKKLFAETWNDVDADLAIMDKLAPRWTHAENRERLAEVKSEIPQLRAVQEAAIALAAGGERNALAEAGNQSADRATPINIVIKKSLGSLSDSFQSLSEEDEAELRADNSSLTLVMGLDTLAALGIGIFVAVFLSRSISGTTRSVLAQAGAIAEGDLTREDLKVHSDDELGDLTRAINRMNGSLKGMIAAISESSSRVSSASELLSQTSQQITANSEQTSAQAKVVSSATAQVSQSLQTVSTGAEQMGISIREIAKNASEAASVATAAVKIVDSTNATVSKLGESSNEIGEVIKVITAIAQQTNLLALNATIEAARAGEAGKGFAVVANEVKELAKETGKATDDISRKIEAIQLDTRAAVSAIASISEVINQVNGISSSIASAVEEQNATTNEMARNVSEASMGSAQITATIEEVAVAAESTSRGAADTQRAAQQLVETSTELRRLVEQFKLRPAGGTFDGANAFKAMAAHAGQV